MIESFLDWIRQGAGQYGYWVIGAAVFLENSAGLGVVIPGDTILVIAGLLAADGTLSLPVILVIGLIAAVVGDNVGYWIGRHGGQPLVRRLEGRYRFMARRLEQGQAYFKSHGGKTVVTGRFVAFIRSFIPFLAGVGHMHYGKFFIYNLIGASLQVVGLILLGYFFGSQLPLLEKILSRGGLVLLAIAVVFAFWWYRRHRAAQKK